MVTKQKKTSGPSPGTVTLPLSEIRRGDNPRRRFDEAELADLTNSVRMLGVLQAIIVRRVAPDEDGTTFAIIAGERRFRAAQRADLSEIPALVRDVDEAEAVEMAIAENMERSQLNAMDEAYGFDLLTRKGRTQQQIAERMHKSQPFVANRIRLLGLPDEVQNLVADGVISASAGVSLCALLDHPEKLVDLADEAVEKGWSVKMIDEQAAAFKRSEMDKVQPRMDVEPVVAIEPEAGEAPREEPPDQAEPESASEDIQAVAAPDAEPAGQVEDDGEGDDPEADAEGKHDDLGEGQIPEPSPDTQEPETLASDAPAVTDVVSGAEPEPEVTVSEKVETPKPAPQAPVAVADKRSSTPTVPATPAAPEEKAEVPEGYTDVPVKMSEYQACAEQGLWPLRVVLETVADLESQVSALQANGLTAEAQAAADELVAINRNSLSVLTEPEIAVLAEMFPEREETQAGHIAAAMLVHRLRSVKAELAQEQPVSLPLAEESEGAGSVAALAGEGAVA